ncbi:MAG: hypothetical protein HQM08_12920 [Candidatus Riflebacteria bacterium]|nr:hypothetical protein [Candidatus Riflebacteria bacterium]
MICCNSCPFNPINASEENKKSGEICQQPECLIGKCHEWPEECGRKAVLRCHLDGYVLRNLSEGDFLAEKLVPFSLDKACRNRDRAMIHKIFKNAPKYLQTKLFNRLENSLEKNLSTLNPIFAAAGLKPLNSFSSESNLHSNYLEAVREDEEVYGNPNISKLDPDLISKIRKAFKEQDADFLCELIRLASPSLRSRLLRFVLIFHSEQMFLFNPIFERNELPPLNPNGALLEKSPYVQAILSTN